MNAAILTIGNEILSGKTLNSNGQTIGLALSNLNVHVRALDTVADDSEAIVAALTRLSRANDIVCITGGLGPTVDDGTRLAVCTWLQCDTKEIEAAKANIEKRYSDRGLEITNEISNQARIPEVAEPLTNKVGAAVGFCFKKNDALLFFMPGVPSEMVAMLNDEVLPRIRDHLGNGDTEKTLTCRFLGVPESTLDGNIRRWFETDFKHWVQPKHIAIQIRFPEVYLRVHVAAGDNEKPLFAALRERIEAEMAESVVDFSDRPIEELVHETLLATQSSLAIAESCTGGYVASQLLAHAGASKYFKAGAISYSDEAKIRMLDVSEKSLQAFGAVSETVAREMAQGVKKRHGTDIGVSLTGILGPEGGSEQKPVGTAFVGLAVDEEIEVFEFQLKRSRLMNRQELTVRTLILLWQRLLKKRS